MSNNFTKGTWFVGIYRDEKGINRVDVFTCLEAGCYNGPPENFNESHIEPIANFWESEEEPTQESIANAYLFAESKELYEACEATMSAIRENLTHAYKKDEVVLYEAFVKLKSALKKARGEA